MRFIERVVYPPGRDSRLPAPGGSVGGKPTPRHGDPAAHRQYLHAGGPLESLGPPLARRIFLDLRGVRQEGGPVSKTEA